MAGSLQRNIAIAIQLINRDFDRGVAAIRDQLAAMRLEVDQNDAAFRRVGAGLAVFAKGAAALSALSGVVGIVAGTTAALQQLLPIVLLLPAGLLAGAAAIATFKIAVAGFADAVKGDAEALAKLSPQARATAEAVRSLEAPFLAVKRAVQEEFFRNFAADVQALGRTYLPLLQQKLPLIARGFNEMGRSVAFALTRPRAVDDVGIVLTNTAKLLSNARNALGAFVAGFTGLGAIGSTYLPRLGIAIDGVAQRFERFVARAGSDGTIRRYIDDAIRGWRDLGAIIGNVTASIGLVFSGLSGGQGDVLGSLRETTQAMRDFLASTSAQSGLAALGDALRVVGDAVRTVLLAALQQLAPIVEQLAPVVAEIARVFGEQLTNAIGIVGPLVVGLSGFLRDHKEVVGLVSGALLILYGRFLLIKGITVVWAGIAALTTALGGLRAVLALGGFIALGAIAVEIDKLNVAAAGGDPEKLKGLASNLNDLVGAGKAILTLDFAGIAKDIEDELGQIGKGFETGESPLGSFFQTISENTSEFVDTTKDSLGQIGGFFSDAARSVGDFALDVQARIDEAKQFIADLPGKAGEALADFGTVIADKASEIWTGFLAKLDETFQPVRDFFSQSPYEMGRAIGENIGELINSGIAIVTSIRDGAVQGFETVVTFFREAPQKIADALGELGTFLGDKAVEGWEAFRTGAQIKIDEFLTFARELPQKTVDALSEFATFLATKAAEAWTSFKTSAQTKIDEAVTFVKDIPRRIGEALGILPSQAQKSGTDTGGGFQAGVTSVFDQVIGFFRDIPVRILQALGNLGTLLVNAGRSILDGLTQGMRDGYNALLDFARGIADGIAAVKGPLPYDRRVLTPAGLAMMDGLLAGLREGNARVLAYASTISTGLAGAIDTGSLIAGAGALTANVSASRTDPTTEALLRRLVAASEGDRTTTVLIDGEPVREIARAELTARDRGTRRTVRMGSA